MIKYLVGFVLLAFISSCGKTNASENKVVGRWQLMQITYVFTVTPDGPGPFVKDVRSQKIEYDFRKNHILVITAEENAMVKPGRFNYEFKRDYLFGAEGEKQFLVIINDEKSVCDFTGDSMTLSTSYMDGSILTFKRKIK